jgi:putative NADH-flavin reductase
VVVRAKNLLIYIQKAVVVLVLLPGISLATDDPGNEPAGSKLIVYGATGRVGSRVIVEALSRGHRVTAVSRDPGRVTQQHQNLSAVRGDVLDPESVAGLVVGHDVIVVAVRGSVDKSKDPEQTVHYVAAQVLVEELRDLGESAPRLIYVGGAGSLEVKPGVLYADSIPRLMRMMMPGSLRQEIAGHVLVLEYLRSVDDVRWTYLSPAKKFGPGERTGSYRIGGDQMLEDEKGKSVISMEDFSVALVDEIENASFIGKRFSVAY